jgi:hypothetical protein
LHYIDLFDDYPFFYAAMVRNMNPKAQARMMDDYNLYGDPTCYYDGGIFNSIGGYPSGQTDTCLSRIFATAARDVHDLELEVHWSWKGGGIIEIYFTVTNIELINDAPATPGVPNGVSEGNVGVEYQFEAVATDSHGNDIFYKWDWGNGDFSEWLGPYNSGIPCNTSYAWFDDGTFNVRVKAKDIWDAESDWSPILPVNIISYVCGDASGDGEVNLLDILFLIAYKYNNPPGEAPDPIEAGDANGDGDINLLDILYLIGYKYNTPPGPEPICPE